MKNSETKQPASIEELDGLELDLRLASGETITVKGRFSNERVEYGAYPDMYRYGIRHSAKDDSVFSSLETGVWVNHAGDFVTETNLGAYMRQGRGSIDIVDWNFTGE